MVVSRDLELARRAYERSASGDIEDLRVAEKQTIEAHQKPAHSSAEMRHGGEGSKYIKPIIFGGLDGIITTFAIVAGVIGADMSTRVVVILGFANLLADAVSMGFGDYLSSDAELQYIHNERKREAWEFDVYPDGEKREMYELYEAKGLSSQDARTVVDTLALYPDQFLDHMMVEELGLMPTNCEDSPIRGGLVTFASFVLFGSVPLCAFIAVHACGFQENESFAAACVITAIGLFALGGVKARFIKQSFLKSGSLMVMNGVAAAGAAFAIGKVLAELIEEKD
eukprot:Rmarinus@m.8076